jgi:DNA-directed RNA polymerase specialized sigma24 family protein
MSSTLTVDFPLIETAYTEEFGEINPEIYEIAKTLWKTCAERLAAELLYDSPKGMRLMLKAVARVSSVRRNNSSQIKNQQAYLYRCYKNLLLAEIEKENSHQRILDDLHSAPEISLKCEEDEINRKILVNEIRRRMDAWTRTVFDCHKLGYTFEEMVPQFGSAANVIRSRYSKDVARLARQINAELEKIDQLFY